MGKCPIDVGNWFDSLSDSIASIYKGGFKNSGPVLLNKMLGDLLLTNYKLWRYEDEARRLDLPDKEIAGLKRNIDKENQKRNDLIDAVDATLKKDIKKTLKATKKNLPMNSETPGSIFDRLTILALRSYNLTKETKRKDVGKLHIDRSGCMLTEVKERAKDLLRCLEDLLVDVYSGRKLFKSYKQHKLYNDPSLNPALRKTFCQKSNHREHRDYLMSMG